MNVSLPFEVEQDCGVVVIGLFLFLILDSDLQIQFFYLLNFTSCEIFFDERKPILDLNSLIVFVDSIT